MLVDPVLLATGVLGTLMRPLLRVGAVRHPRYWSAFEAPLRVH